MSNGWHYIDFANIIEQTVSGNAGAFAVPLGPMLRRYPTSSTYGSEDLSSYTSLDDYQKRFHPVHKDHKK